ncbi:hypothetical protein VCRA2120O389_160061 [Vibrio crassostreae]|nr:hypothetical protein VCRA2113O199_180019 [Vibrio crassostreae]CAK2176046.1 hypothetical protein VCRA2119O381_690008 [Vibrio crassostreae]CAK2290169.1 hypothetical protein VCRA2113O361_190019 [Vibrio crassostreae]CAK2458936.1 hypothetical protein VCRA2116O374_210062 [Vibrio crassostreae]CAK2460013.1 hypothetical protein VCRA2117O377_210062 [Vibrio crassostreae]
MLSINYAIASPFLTTNNDAYSLHITHFGPEDKWLSFVLIE